MIYLQRRNAVCASVALLAIGVAIGMVPFTLATITGYVRSYCEPIPASFQPVFPTPPKFMLADRRL
jgi:hypothetical protein